MMKKKRIIAIILSFTIVLGSVLAVTAPIAAYKNRVESAVRLGADVSDMCSRYDDAYENTDSLDEADTVISERLIVKSDEPIDTYDSIDYVSGSDMYFLQFENSDSAKKAYDKYTEQGKTVEYDRIRSCDAVSTISHYSNDWGYERIEAKETLDYFNLRVNSQIVVAVADSGIYYSHDWFSGKRIIKTDYNISGTGITDDEVDDNGPIYHGTGVAGVIANCTPTNVKIKAYKVLNSSGKTTESRLTAFYSYLLEMNESDRPDILNMSYGSEAKSDLEEQLLTELYNDGMVLVAAAGNDNHNAGNHYPSGLDCVISVSATDYMESGNEMFLGNKIASFSNYGKAVDITAPGAYIEMPYYDYTDRYSTSSMRQGSGTSFSAPMVSAGAAIILMQNKKLKPAEVKEKLISSATPIDNPKESTFAGAGMLNLYNLIDAKKVEPVEFSVKSGFFDNEFELKLSCSNSLVKIIYTTDYSLPSLTNGTEYTEPIKISDDTRVIAAAFPKINTRQRSYFYSESYQFKKSVESDYEIDETGCITKYKGNDSAIVIPDTINGITPTKIGESVFTRIRPIEDYGLEIAFVQYCELPSTITEISGGFDGAFTDSELRYIKGDGVIIAGGFDGCEYLYGEDMPNVKKLDWIAFKNCKSIKDFSFRDSVEILDSSCFEGTDFENGDFPNVTEACSDCFFNSSIKSAVMPKVKTIGAWCFANCGSLTELYIPMTESIGEKAFANCVNLTCAVSLENIETVGVNAFYDSYFSSIDLPGCKAVEKSAFYNCHSVQISLPKAETVGESAFYDCTNLSDINLDNVKSFKNRYHFYNCYKLKRLYLPNAEDVPYFLFSNKQIKSDLEYIYAPKADKWNFFDNEFENAENLKFIYIPNAQCEFRLSAGENEVVVFFSNRLNDNNGVCNGNVTMVGPEGQVAEAYAGRQNCKFIAGEGLSFSQYDGENYIYSNGTDSVSLPADIVDSMWENSVINNCVGDETYTFLLDLNNDGYVNAKDYAVIYHR